MPDDNSKVGEPDRTPWRRPGPRGRHIAETLSFGSDEAQAD